MAENTYEIEVTRRPWYEWVAWAVWLLVVLFLFQNALASGAEFEPAAAAIFWATFAVVSIGGVIVYFLRRRRLTE